MVVNYENYINDMRNPKYEDLEDRRKILHLSGDNIDKYKSYVMYKHKF